MGKIVAIFLAFQLLVGFTKAQDFGGEKVGISNFVKRIYEMQNFEGIKILQSQEGIHYMISVVTLQKDSTKSEAILNRIASIKAKMYASQYVNGSSVSSEVTVITNQEKMKDSTILKINMIESIKESSTGFAEGMELLTNFESYNGRKIVYIYYRKIKN